MPDVIILKEMQGFCDATCILYKWSIYVPLEISFSALYTSNTLPILMCSLT